MWGPDHIWVKPRSSFDPNASFNPAQASRITTPGPYGLSVVPPDGWTTPRVAWCDPLEAGTSGKRRHPHEPRFRLMTSIGPMHRGRPA